MIKQDFHIANIIARYLSGELTSDESVRLDDWRKESADHEALFRKICDEENLRQHIEKSTAFHPNTGWAEVQKRIRQNSNRTRMLKVFRYAAAVLLPIFFVGIGRAHV